MDSSVDRAGAVAGEFRIPHLCPFPGSAQLPAGQLWAGEGSTLVLPPEVVSIYLRPGRNTGQTGWCSALEAKPRPLLYTGRGGKLLLKRGFGGPDIRLQPPSMREAGAGEGQPYWGSSPGRPGEDRGLVPCRPSPSAPPLQGPEVWG